MQLSPSINKKDFINTFLLIMLYGLGVYGVQLLFHHIGIFSNFPTSENLVAWDASWYESIARTGYKYSDSIQSNTGFFYLLSFIWKVSGWGICLVNLFFFATGFSLLCSMLRLPVRDKVLWLTMPSVIFALVPYAEALFFLLTTLCVYGITANKRWLIWMSLFLLSLTRATAIFVVPAFLCMELTANPREQWLKSVLRYLQVYVLPALAGLGLFILIQYQQTHVWFAYFVAQSVFWKRVFTIPIFPLINSTGTRTILLNALALFACFTAFIFTVTIFVQWLLRNKQRDRALVLSMCYLAVTLLTALFYSPQWMTGATDVIGAFRYAMLNPFFYIFLHYFTRQLQYRWQHYLLAFLFASGVWMAFGAYVHLQAFLFFATNTVMIMLYMLTSNRKLEWPAIILTMINVLIQVHLFQQFIGRIALVD